MQCDLSSLLSNGKGWKNIKGKGIAEWFSILQENLLNPPCGCSGWWRLCFILLFLALKDLEWGWRSPSLLPKGSPSVPVIILWLPRASLNCGSCRELIAWTWGSHGWPLGHSLHYHHHHWLLPHCFGGVSMSVWLHWWIAVGSNRNPFQEDHGVLPQVLGNDWQRERVNTGLKMSPLSFYPSNSFSIL